MLPAGRLRHRLRLQRLEVGHELDSDGEEDSDGAIVEQWVDAFSRPVPAEITPLSGRDLIAAQAVQSKVTHRIRVRFHPSIGPTMRGVCGGTIYSIEAVSPDPGSGRRWLTLFCASGVNEG